MPLSLPCVITLGTSAFGATYYKYFVVGVWSKWLRPICQYIYGTISPKSAAFIKELREAAFGDTLVKITKSPQLHWDGYKDAFGSVTLPIYQKAKGIFLKGNEPAWPDFITSSPLLAIRLLCGTDSEEWEYIKT